MPAPPTEPPSSGGFQIGDVDGNLNVTVGREWVRSDKIVNITKTTTIQISVEAVTQKPLVTASPYRGLDRFEDRDKDLFFGAISFSTACLPRSLRRRLSHCPAAEEKFFVLLFEAIQAAIGAMP
jgi:hypothetical protein